MRKFFTKASKPTQRMTLLSIVIIATFMTCPSQASEFDNLEPTTIIMADGTAKGAVANLWAKLFSKNLSELTHGKITVEYHGNSELGGDPEIIKKMQAGKVDMCGMQSMNAVPYVKELGVLELPLVFAKYNAKTIDKAVRPGSEFFSELNKCFRASGFELIDYLQGGTYREMSSNVPVRKIEDFKGIKIRTLTSEYQVSFWKNLGCEPVPIAFEKLYDALKDGVVEAEENAIDTQANSGFYNVQKYLIMTHHVLYGNLFYMTSEKFNSLSPSHQKAVRGAAQRTSAQLRRRIKEINDEALRVMMGGRVEIIELSDEVIDDIIRATEETSKLIRKNIGDEICDLLINSLADAK